MNSSDRSDGRIRTVGGIGDRKQTSSRHVGVGCHSATEIRRARDVYGRTDKERKFDIAKFVATLITQIMI
jgi:hypothetical protein